MGYIIAYFAGFACGCFFPFVVAANLHDGRGKFEKRKRRRW